MIGVFTAFTLSQAGMVRYWRWSARPQWRWRAAVNGIGAATTGLVTVIVIQAKFTEGAWMVTIAIPVLWSSSSSLHQPPLRAASPGDLELVRRREGTAGRPSPSSSTSRRSTRPRGGRRGTPVRSPGPTSRRCTFPGTAGPIREAWWDVGRVPIETLPQNDKPAEPLLDYVWGLPRRVRIRDGGRSGALRRALAHGRDLPQKVAFSVQLRLRSGPEVVVTERPADPQGRLRSAGAACGARPSLQRAGRLAARGQLRPVAGVEDTRAFFAAFDDAEVHRLENDWAHAGLSLPLDIAEAPYRDLGASAFPAICGR